VCVSNILELFLKR